MAIFELRKFNTDRAGTLNDDKVQTTIYYMHYQAYFVVCTVNTCTVYDVYNLIVNQPEANKWLYQEIGRTSQEVRLGIKTGWRWLTIMIKIGLKRIIF